jgi:pimeloyl-ACP methyl ester carboxylesterase
MSSASERGLTRSRSLPPYEHQYLSLDGLRIHYAEISADGPPLLLLHGIGMDWRVWQSISRWLHPHFHLYLLDLRGHGQSDKPPHGYLLSHYAADVEDLIDTLELCDATLVGSSLGGMVAATVEAPVDMVSHRILIDPPITGGPVRDVEMFQTILRLKHEPAERLADYLALSNPGAGKLYLRTMSEMWHQASDGVIEDMLESAENYNDLRPALQANESQTLLLRADPAMNGVLSAEHAKAASSLLAHGSVLEVPGAGHAIHAYKPAEFTRIVKEFSGTPAAAN